MADKYQSARILLKLYELRQEATMREARDWFVAFSPTSAEDVLAAVQGPQSHLFRMVTTYWDMAASFVTHEVVDAEMFNDTILEHIAVFAKLEPHIERVRELFAEPRYLAHLERLVRQAPDSAARMEQMRQRMKVFARVRREAAAGEAPPAEHAGEAADGSGP